MIITPFAHELIFSGKNKSCEVGWLVVRENVYTKMNVVQNF